MRLRLLEPSDIRRGLEIWPIPNLAPTETAAVLVRALVAERLRGAVVEHSADGALLAVGISGFVRGACIERARDAGPPLVAELLASESREDSDLLSVDAQAEAMRDDDLHLVVLMYRQHVFDAQEPHALEVLRAGHAAFRLVHEGYRLRSVWQEGEAADEAWMHAGGLQVKRTYPSPSGPGRILCGRLREEVGADWPGYTVSFLFHDQAQTLHLTPMQRRVAHLALWNLSDEAVASRLSISTATVRQHWRGIFERVERTHPNVIGVSTPADAHAGRGPEKRSRVLEFLRLNLHEVRPAP